jgi:hypothetical protein
MFGTRDHYVFSSPLAKRFSVCPFGLLSPLSQLFLHFGTCSVCGFLEDIPGGLRMSDGLEAISQLVERQARVPQSAPFCVPVTKFTRDLQLLRVALDRKSGLSQPGPRFPDVAKNHCLSTAVAQVTDKLQKFLVAPKRAPGVA